eukprot:CAMPEP_0113464304 /NCGR_PEP_ID=MMETSP0014_2-20120614/13133_1 /TAXON_ID=2857 /ORGANISM="Nitzschia sp." /LENGTH=223 /DNA_ID=CAMNT_0000356383 /DNA_START=106 /DNA_END=777 /DNA_ORIENTATION=- /assembly_acc=CAM_ASM_000159
MMNKLLVALFLSAAAVAVNGQDNPPCYICGDEGERVTDPTFVVEVPGQLARTCEEVEAAGLAGLISEAQCGFLPGIFAVPCGCEEIPVPVNPIEPVPENLPEEGGPMTNDEPIPENLPEEGGPMTNDEPVPENLPEEGGPMTNDEPVPENLPEDADPATNDEPIPEQFEGSEVPSDMPSLMPSGAPSVMVTDEGATDAPSGSMTVAGSAVAVAMTAVVAVFMM